MSKQARPKLVDVAEAARMLRAVVEALPPLTTTDRATARRVEGAAIGLEAVAGVRGTAERPQTIV